MDPSNDMYPTPSPKRDFIEFCESRGHYDSTQEITNQDKRQRYSFSESFTRYRSPLRIPSGANTPCSSPSTPAVYPLSVSPVGHSSTETDSLAVLRYHAEENIYKNPRCLGAPRIEVNSPDSYAGRENCFKNLHLNDTDTPISFNEEYYDEDDIVMHQEINGPEMCFGMIKYSTIVSGRADYLRQLCVPQVVNSKRSKLKTHTQIETTINFLKSLATVHLSSGDKEYIGILDDISAKGISQILEIPSVRLQAFLPSPQPSPELPPEEIPKTKTKEPQNSIFIYINVYGASSVGDDVGKILSTNRIYLQSPVNNEKKPKYKNPHYFNENEHVTTSQVTASPSRLRNVEEKVKTIFDININDKLPEIKMGDELQTSLLSHQKQAVYFMLWKETAPAFHEEDMLTSTSIYKPIKNELGVVSYLNSITKEKTCARPQAVPGGILADDMGLGKSLTTLALITGSLDQAHLFTQSTNYQYYTTLNRVRKHARATLIVAPASLLESWKEQIRTHIKPGAVSFYTYHGAQKDISIEKLMDFDIVLTTYATIRAEVFSKQVNQYRRSPLKEIKWFRMVLDEAHIIREHSTQQSKAVCMLEAQRRWCLSGTPIQNKLQDFGTLLRFLRLSPFDEEGTFSKYIVRPLKDANPEGLRCLCILIGSTCLRRTKDILELPPKIDQEVYIHLEPPERRLYEICKKDSANMIEQALTESRSGSSYFSILQSILRLRLMCDHGKDLLPSMVQNRLEGYSYADHINPQTSSDIEMEDCVQEESPTQQIASEFFAPRCALCSKTIDAAEAESEATSSQTCPHTICDSCLRLPYGGPSTKVKALIRNLQLDAGKDSEGKPIKSVVFSCWTKMLDLVAIALNNEQMRFCRGAVGLNLTVASRVHLMEPQWNPMVEHQALDRVHRIGQKNEVVTTRYIVKNSIEESMLSFQKRKLAIAGILTSQTQKSTSNQHLKELQNLLMA
ncbi:uncharacterized protein LAJ45_05105 [Morchella importuna]|uniref:uncharacterized protein n=1 Tax=Morchella importuna TaxID=1174673 RepID=UPI001E8ECC39|nr:uncharacterized protein LAJ45_05105 [Morchella importuna]KAH8150923.1 hypothetical protein LAJ45_05105 [Morchella importuna]